MSFEDEEDFIDEEKLDMLEDVYDKLKFYCDFHNLNFLNKSKHFCINNLMNII